jgi:hypothetical protein
VELAEISTAPKPVLVPPDASAARGAGINYYRAGHTVVGSRDLNRFDRPIALSRRPQRRAAKLSSAHASKYSPVFAPVHHRPELVA